MEGDRVVHTHNGKLAILKNGILPFAAPWMGLETATLTEESQTQKDNIVRYCLLKGERRGKESEPGSQARKGNLLEGKKRVTGS